MWSVILFSKWINSKLIILHIPLLRIITNKHNYFFLFYKKINVYTYTNDNVSEQTGLFSYYLYNVRVQLFISLTLKRFIDSTFYAQKHLSQEHKCRNSVKKEWDSKNNEIVLDFANKIIDPVLTTASREKLLQL